MTLDDISRALGCRGEVPSYLLIVQTAALLEHAERELSKAQYRERLYARMLVEAIETLDEIAEPIREEVGKLVIGILRGEVRPT